MSQALTRTHRTRSSQSCFAMASTTLARAATFSFGRDGVLEVEERHVRRDRRRLREELLRRARRREAGTAGQVTGALGHARRLPSRPRVPPWRGRARARVGRVRTTRGVADAAARRACGTSGSGSVVATEHHVTAARPTSRSPPRSSGTCRRFADYADWLESTIEVLRRRRPDVVVGAGFAERSRISGVWIATIRWTLIDLEPPRHDGRSRRGRRGASRGSASPIELAEPAARRRLRSRCGTRPRLGPLGMRARRCSRASNVTNDQKRSVRHARRARRARGAPRAPARPRLNGPARQVRRGAGRGTPRCGRT